MLNPYKKNLKAGYTQTAKPVRSIVKIYESLCLEGKEKRSGRALLVCCPFHGEDNPSCALYEDTNSYYCFSCGVHGDYITFVEKLQGVDFKEALSIIERI